MKKFKAGELVSLTSETQTDTGRTVDCSEILDVIREIKFSTYYKIIVHLRTNLGENVFTERKNLTRVGIC